MTETTQNSPLESFTSSTVTSTLTILAESNFTALDMMFRNRSLM